MTVTTRADIDRLVAAATPHFAYQIRQRIENLVSGLDDDDDLRRYAKARLAQLDGLGFATSKGDYGDPSAPA